LTTAVGLAEATVLLALAFPRLVPSKVVNLLTYAPSPTSTVYADSLYSPSLFASDSPSSLIPFALGTGLVIGGCLLRKWCFTTMGNMFTFEIKVQEEHRLVTWGPYAYVRHPSYTGLIMIFAGLGIWQASPGSWIRESGVLETTVGRVFAGFAALWNATMGMIVWLSIVWSSRSDTVYSCCIYRKSSNGRSDAEESFRTPVGSVGEEGSL